MDLLWLGDEACHDRARTGGKAAQLSRLAGAHPVPPGFCLAATAWERALAAGPRLDEEGSGLAALPAALAAGLAAAYARLAETVGVTQPRVAVRSSAIDEDGSAASFAGQHETFLNLAGVDAIARAVVRCWASAAGDRALADLRTYLETYGRRGDKVTVSQPSWIEDPTPVITSLKAYLPQPERDLAAERAALAAERERRVAEAPARLQGYPRPVVEQFEFLLTAAQAATVLEEEHNFWIDYSATDQVRRVLLEFGRRFAAAGAFDQPNDVFYLTLAELRETATRLPESDRRRVVAERRAELDHFRTVAPPPALGTLPPGPPPDSPFVRMSARFAGTPPPPSTEPGVLLGSAGSPGTARGPARVLRALAEADKLQPGDILVAATTAPPWTPLFATAAAVVTDAGGVLSHGAVVAREYGIPAVVGAGRATATLQDGQVIEVDGDAGLVRLLDAHSR